jgi:predicted nucleic acid-binding protein
MARLYRALERLGRMLRRGEVSLDGAMEELERVAFDPSYSEAWAKMERDARRLGGRVGVRL